MDPDIYILYVYVYIYIYDIYIYTFILYPEYCFRWLFLMNLQLTNVPMFAPLALRGATLLEGTYREEFSSPGPQCAIRRLAGDDPFASGMEGVIWLVVTGT